MRLSLAAATGRRGIPRETASSTGIARRTAAAPLGRTRLVQHQWHGEKKGESKRERLHVHTTTAACVDSKEKCKRLFQTPRGTPLRRLGHSAGVMTFLAGQDRAWVNAQVLRVNGGFA
jgi:hypothetical protein